MNTSPYDFDVVTGPSTPPEEGKKPPEPESDAEPPQCAPEPERPQK